MVSGHGPGPMRCPSPRPGEEAWAHSLLPLPMGGACSATQMPLGPEGLVQRRRSPKGSGESHTRWEGSL